MAAWQQLAWQSLRPEARHPRIWRTRCAFAALFALTGAWAAAAPQAALGLGDRLRLAFHAITALGAVLAVTAGLRHQTPALEDSLLSLTPSQRAFARFFANISKAIQELIPTIPLVLFLFALHAISALELLQSFFVITILLLASLAIPSFRLACALIFICALFLFARRYNFFETAIAALFVSHLAAKAFIAWTAISSIHATRQNLADESLAPGVELFPARRRELWRRFKIALTSLIAANAILLSLLFIGAPFPVTLEQKLALAFILASGILLLLLDSFALIWRGMLGGLKTGNPRQTFAYTFAMIIGIPWAAAWAFSAMHAGEAFTLNEGAAYFFLWIALGSTLSWLIGASAREKLQHDFRQLLSEP